MIVINGLRFEHIGMLLRGLLWQLSRLRFDGIVLKGRGARIFLDRRVRLDGITKVGHYATLDLRQTASGRLGNRFSLGDYSVFRASGSPDFTCPFVDIAERVSFGPYCNIGGGFGLSIGADVIAGPYVSIHPEEHMHAADILIRSQQVFGQGICIQGDCWLGAKTTILDGSNLAFGTVLGAATLVAGTETRKNGIYVGAPARFIRFRERDDEKLR
ncbi:hypothetical protein [Prosthecochloris vibrioformis]|uniref:Acyltransferase n=1 Tax=Prosthecochloris vibrioformis TaxID=1098 RepID=A0A5C4RSV0_PROVB|nr:hypothetical protein [Prosthecochloris vibrioformis]TNJ34059.1 hypothetical protein FGF68_10530 [Prosthecochloris vibrioformis]